MDSRTLAKKRLKNSILRDKQTLSMASMISLKEELTLLTSEFFDVDELTAEINSVRTEDNKRLITFSVKIK
ncbi:MAG: cell division topological specificity factor MinE [Eubacteriaceae bacterium]|nr:cell division topological specificity factor MinE [Eubacteriaceae bacterium]